MSKIALSPLDMAVKDAIQKRLKTNKAGRPQWQELADELDVTRGYLYQVYTGQRHATQRLAKLLGISATKYAPHPVMRLSKLRRLMQSPYNAA